MGIYGPWDAIDTGETDDDEANFIANYLPNYGIIESLGEAYSATVISSSGYPYSSYFHYEEGADWYPLYGSVNDWALGTKGSVCYSVELYGKQNYTTANALLLDSIWDAHRDAILGIIEKSSLGTGGRLLKHDGSPAAGAMITLSGAAGRAFDPDNPEPYTELKGITDADGYFRFITAAGSYRISFTLRH